MAVREDLEKLKKDFGIPYQCYCDLGAAAKRVERNSGVTKFGLASLHTLYTGAEVTKTKSIQMSNWELSHLSDKQIQYAAWDALMGAHIYNKLHSLGAFNTDALKEEHREQKERLVCSNRQQFKYMYRRAHESNDMMTTFKKVLQNENIEHYRAVASPSTGSAAGSWRMVYKMDIC